MVSLKNMKTKVSSFKIHRNKKAEKLEKNENAIEEDAAREIKPTSSDPIMEDREDAEEMNVVASRSAEEERIQMEVDERSPPGDDEAEPEAEAEAEPESETEREADAEADPAPKGDDSVMTETNANAAGDDGLSTVNEEPSREEAEEKAVEETAPLSEKKQEESGSVTQTMDDGDDGDRTMDQTANSTLPDTECVTPVNAPAFCGCFFGN